MFQHKVDPEVMKSLWERVRGATLHPVILFVERGIAAVRGRPKRDVEIEAWTDVVKCVFEEGVRIGYDMGITVRSYDPPVAKLSALGRKPTIEDYDAWKAVVYDRAEEIDHDADIDWSDMALGFLLARGVDYGFIPYDLLSVYSCLDGQSPSIAREEMAKIVAAIAADVDMEESE